MIPAPHEPELDDPNDAASDDNDRAYGDLRALEDPANTDVTWYVYRLTDDGAVVRAASDNEPAYLFRFVGVFDLELVRERVGGGYFRVIGRRGKLWLMTKNVRIEGTPKSYAQTSPPSPPASSAPSAPSVEVAQLRAELGELKQLIVQQRVNSGDDLDRFVKFATLMRELAPRANGPSLENTIEIFQRGIELGTRSEGGTSWPDALRDTLPEVLNFMRDRATVSTPSPARAVAPDSVNAQVDDLVALIARAIARGTAVEQLAELAVSVMTESELARVRAASAEQMLAMLKPFEARYPVLNDARLPEYVRAFLAEMQIEGDPSSS